MVFVKSEGSPLLPGGSFAKTRSVKWTAAAVLLCACVIVASVASFKPAVDAIKAQQQMTELMGASRLAADDAEIDAIADKVCFTLSARVPAADALFCSDRPVIRAQRAVRYPLHSQHHEARLSRRRIHAQCQHQHHSWRRRRWRRRIFFASPATPTISRPGHAQEFAESQCN